MLVNPISQQRRRKGIILLVVISLLTLFAVVGLSFVLYSEGAANSARIFREARQDRKTDPEIPPLSDDDVNKLLGELVYGVDPAPTNVASNMWYGHDLASAMYGWKQNQPGGVNINTVAYGGPGLQPRTPATGVPVPNGFSLDRIVRFGGDTYTNFKVAPEFYTDANNPANQVYIPKNSDYTYPDLKDFYLAALDPNTGRVLVPSFHRPWLFDLDPTKGNGSDMDKNNVLAKYRSLRPHPSEHPNFPLPHRSYRQDTTTGQTTYENTFGDVENLPNKNAPGVAIHQFDSIWMDVGFPVRQIRGKNYKPLIAPLILDLDNRLNINVAGNINHSSTDGSDQGWGPWEMNLAQVFLDSTGGQQTKFLLNPDPNTFANFTYSRFGVRVVKNPNPPPPPLIVLSGTPIKPYDGRPTASTSVDTVNPGQGAPPYSNLNFDGFSQNTSSTGMTQLQIPSNTSNGTPPLGQFSTLPVFGSNYANGGQIGTDPYSVPPNQPVYERTRHPSFFNPYYFNSNPTTLPTGIGPSGNKTFSLDNFRFLNAKYDYESNIPQSELYRLYQNLMPYPQLVTDMRNRPWAKVRWLTTVISNDLDRVGHMPWQIDLAGNSFGATVQPNMPLPQPRAISSPTGYQPTQAVAANNTNSDLDPNWQSKSGMFSFVPYPPGDFRAATAAPVNSSIVPLDLARPLIDYREDATKPYDSPGNVVAGGKASLAVADRQQFAKDIFDRLVVATFGVRPAQLYAAKSAAFTDNSGNTPEYPALMWLAQLAANIVDYIDGDDYMTPFFWNLDPGRQQTDVVYGTEMPRLVFNEIYSRVSNDKADLPMPNLNAMMKRPATKPYRFETFIELVNPLTLDANDTNLPMTMSHAGGAVLNFNGTPVYQLVIRDGLSSTGAIRDWKNADGSNSDTTQLFAVGLGMFDGTGNPTTGTVVVGPFDRNGTEDGPTLGSPNTSPTTPPTTYVGFYLLGPKTIGDAADIAIKGPSGDKIVPSEQVSQLDDNGSTFPINTQQANLTKPRTYVLQRLACSHLPWQKDPTQANYNPYVVVDYLEYSGDPKNAGARLWDNRYYDDTDMNMMRDPYGKQKSHGRFQPYMGLTNPSVSNLSYLIDQTNSNASPTSDTAINHTFYQQNNFIPPMGMGPIKVGPFHWLRHLDRVPINQMELMGVSSFKPHELTHEFLRARNGAMSPYQNADLLPNQQTAQWLDYNDEDVNTNGGATGTDNGRTNGLRLSRFLGLVSCHSRMFGIASGGRVPGRINVNTIWSSDNTGSFTSEVLQSAFDPRQPQNLFNVNDVNNVYTRLVQQRSPAFAFSSNSTINRIPSGIDQLDMASGTTVKADRPFYGLAAPSFYNPAPAPNGDPLAFGVSRTLLKPGLANLNATNAGTLNGPYPNAAAAYDGTKPHPYWIQEPLTKALPNFTTRSNCFLLICTIGYFECDSNGKNLGKEIGNDDGSIRRDKFMAVIDRSNLTIDGGSSGGSPSNVGLFHKAGPKPVCYPFEPVAVNGTPITGVSTDDVITQTQVPTQVTVRVPTAYSAVAGANLVGYDDGGMTAAPNWIIVPKGNNPVSPAGPLKGAGTYIQIDTGDNAEVVEVTAVSSVQSNGVNDAGGGQVTFTITKPHRRGALMLFGAKFLDSQSPPQPMGGVPIILGNPGPQPAPTAAGGFDFRKEPYNAVVPYVAKDID